MTLLDALSRLPQLSNRVPALIFERTMTLYFLDVGNRQLVIDRFGIPSGFLTDFDKFKDHYDNTLTNAVERDEWLKKFNACVSLLQWEVRAPGEGITKAQFNNILGLDLDET